MARCYLRSRVHTKSKTLFKSNQIFYVFKLIKRHSSKFSTCKLKDSLAITTRYNQGLKKMKIPSYILKNKVVCDIWTIL